MPINRSQIKYQKIKFFWFNTHTLVINQHLYSSIQDGFRDRPESETQFDALISLYGMINFVQVNYPICEPIFHRNSKMEECIFRQEQPVKEF